MDNEIHWTKIYFDNHDLSSHYYYKLEVGPFTVCAQYDYITTGKWSVYATFTDEDAVIANRTCDTRKEVAYHARAMLVELMLAWITALGDHFPSLPPSITEANL
jgi:hypothetical protein